MKRPDTHKCPCGCARQIPYRNAICPDTFTRVPRNLREELVVAWASGYGAGSARLGTALFKALRAADCAEDEQ